MVLKGKDALELVKKHNDGSKLRESLIAHVSSVALAAERIASALKLDSDKALALGYIHDIGKMFYGTDREDGALVHGIRGYEYIKSLGYDEEYARICILHSYLNNDIDCLSAERTNRLGEKFDFQYNYVVNHEYTDYEKIICLCDLMCTDKILTMEKRLIDLLIRHGVFDTSHYHLLEAMKLKKYIEEKLGFSLYDLFPEVKENL